MRRRRWYIPLDGFVAEAAIVRFAGLMLTVATMAGGPHAVRLVAPPAKRE